MRCGCLRHRRPPLDIATVVAEFRPGIAELSTTLDSHLRGKVRDQLFANEAARLAAGVPESVAQRSGAVAVDAHRRSTSSTSPVGSV